MGRYTLLLDVAGRVSQEATGYEFPTCAGVALESTTLGEARHDLVNGLPKWKASKDDDLDHITALVCKNALACLVLRVAKVEPEWSALWSDAEDYCRELSSRVRRRAGFAKAAQFIRYMLFGECSGRLLGECVKASGRPRILDARGLGVVEISAICDSDIQGRENVKVFHLLWEMFEKSPQRWLATAGLTVKVRNTALCTEQEEPLLLYADYLAGLFHAEVAPAGKPPAVTEEAIRRARLTVASKVIVVDKAFDIPYRAVYGKGEIGEHLWGSG